MDFWQNLPACKTMTPFNLPPSLEQRLRRLWTVSIISCCCLCRAVLFPVARLSWVSSSLITPLCLPTSVWRLPFSCFSVSSSSWCRISISNIFCSRRLGGKKGQEKFVMEDGKVVLCYYPSGHWNPLEWDLFSLDLMDWILFCKFSLC